MFKFIGGVLAGIVLSFLALCYSIWKGLNDGTVETNRNDEGQMTSVTFHQKDPLAF